ncbi:DUF6575 domain-containing protein [Pseudanabaena sp. Chao 1811]|uniref:DUF6575 domain-containing protein n=1 Tax=Pseudanabaena sp. Chao 1811 TaxID=2963092 RepID=UPI0022F4069D|nr:DUF6575 domain-containing protein [Pseudanabaena sp. Chao 1811]
MNLLPKYTYLGKLNIVEVYEAYDEPCLFACKNASGQIFLAVLIDEDEEYKHWLYTPLSQKRFEYVRSGGIDLHDSFKLAEDGFVHRVKVPFIDEQISEIEVLPCENLSKDMLPLAGEFIHLETQTLPILLAEELKQTALSLWREVLRFKVKFPKYTRNEAPIKMWGNMLSSLQEVIDSIGYQIEDNTKKIISQQTELLSTATSGGSYAVDLVAATNVNLLRDSLIGEALDVFFKLIDASNSSNINTEVDSRNNDFIEIVNTLGRRFASKYRIFLNFVADAESDVNFDWGSPHPEKGGSTMLTYRNAINALYLISKMEITAPEILEVSGVLVGGNIESKRFELRSISEEFKYKGEIADSLLTSDIDMTLEDIYKATIEETIEVNKVTGETKAKYKLVNLELLKLEINKDS